MVSIRSVKITTLSPVSFGFQAYSLLFSRYNNFWYLIKSFGVILSKESRSSSNNLMSFMSSAEYFLYNFFNRVSILFIQAAGLENKDFSRLVLNNCPVPLLFPRSISSCISAKMSYDCSSRTDA